MRGFAFFVALMTLPLTVLADLGAPANIDIVRVASSTKRVFLYVVLLPQENLERGDNEGKLRRKLEIYRRYVASGQVWKDEPTADRSQPVALVVVVGGELTPAVKSRLDRMSADFAGGTTSLEYFQERELEEHLKGRSK